MYAFVLYVFSFSLLVKNAVSQHSWSNTVDGTCKFTVNRDLDIRFEQNPLLFIDRLNADDLSSCRKLCCDHKTCNGYVWSGGDSINEQCKLLKCSNEGTDCKNALTKNILGKINHEVGFITGIAEPTNALDAVLGTPAPSIGTTTFDATKIASSTALLQSKSTTTLVSPPVAGISSARKSVETTVKTLTTKSATSTATTSMALKSTPTITTTLNVPIVEISNEDQEPENKTPKQNTNDSRGRNKTTLFSVKSNEKRTRLKSFASNSTRKGVIPRDEHNGHSDDISLMAALMFGLAFFIMTFFLVGKRWIESIRESHHRTGYTRISYLLNGV